MWKLILEPNLGSLNTLLGRFGFESLRHNWLGDEGLVLYVIVVVAIWQQIGLYVVIYFAGLQSIDPTLYEAAASTAPTDGSSCGRSRCRCCAR